MSFFAIFIALLLEQVRPLARHSLLHGALRSWARGVSRNFDAGRAHHGWVAWSLLVLVPSGGVLALHWLLAVWVGWPAAVLWSVVVLYPTLGFRQFSHHFTGIRDALTAGDEARARELLARWQQLDAADLPRREIVRHVIEYSVLAAHRHVFGVLLWFSVLAAMGLGPAGAVFYRLSEFAARHWGGLGAEMGSNARPTTSTEDSSGPDFSAMQARLRESQLTPLDTAHLGDTDHTFASAAARSAALSAWRMIDWLPARATAVAFAVVGSFEEAIDAWRNQAQRFPADSNGVVLAATAGAINVRLGAMSAPFVGSEPDDMIPGREPELGHLAQVVGLVWRSVVLWMVLLALLTLARLLG
jgi:adenosylcobinamide-phosphate synthase